MNALVARNTARFIATPLGDDVVMMDLERGDFIELNPVAADIWRALEQPRTFEDLVRWLTTEFDVPADQCAAETKQYLEAGAAAGFLTITHES